MTLLVPAMKGSLAPRLLRHWIGLFSLAWPVMLSRAGMLILFLTGIVMVGRHDTVELAELALGGSIFGALLVTGVGCMVGIISTTARERGAGATDLPAILLRGLRWALVVGIALSLLVYGSEPLLRLIGHESELAAGAGAVARMLAPGLLFQVLFVAASFYLEGTGRMKPGLVAMVVANVINLALCWLLIGGRFGFPPMGAEGAALAGTVARLGLAVGILAWITILPEFGPWRGRIDGLWGPGGWAAGAEMRRIGLAGGAAYFFETAAFATMAQVAGLIGTTALAAYTILHNIEALVFMTALGLSVATSVRVGQAAGAGAADEARLACGAGVSGAMLMIGGIGLVLLAFAPSVVGFFSTDPALVARAAPLIALLAVTMIFDAGQVVLGQSTRALGDSWGTTLVFFIAFWCVMVPMGLILGFHTDLAEAGLFIATGMGCVTAAALLGFRFRILVARRAKGCFALMGKPRPKVLSFLAYLPQAAMLALARALPARARLAFGAAFTRALVATLPSLRGRVENNLKLIFPGMPPAERARVRAGMADSFGRTMIEVMTRADFQKRADWTGPEGPGWEVLKDARAEGRGALLVSGHFGQWEAVRGALLAHGIESGAMIRPVKNPWLNRDYLACVEAGGRPVLGRDGASLRELVRHVRDGGVMSILLDQYTKRGAAIDFLGHPAPSGTMIADLARKFDLPMIPVYGTRQPDGITVRVEFEAPIAPGSAIEMTQAAANSLAARVRATPEQYYWLHRRWVKVFPD